MSAIPATSDLLRDRTVVLDCRWLGMGGAGRITELLLREFQASPPPGRWVLWGRDDRIEPLRFGDATIAADDTNPRALGGQGSLRSVPKGDLVVYMHQIRPLLGGASITAILDTIQLHHCGNRLARAAKRVFLRRVARISRQILTISEHSKATIHRDLSVPLERITVMNLGVDVDRARRIWERRSTTERRKRLLYVGRFDEHKNLERLCLAFGASGFAADSGELLIVGGWNGEVEPLRRHVVESGLTGIEIRGACSEEELDELLASSTALILPSLEEGYGLPAFEAAATGLPVAVSRTGAMTELPEAVAVQFDAEDLEGMTAAIDAATARPAGPPLALHPRYLGNAVLSAVASAL